MTTLIKENTEADKLGDEAFQLYAMLFPKAGDRLLLAFFKWAATDPKLSPFIRQASSGNNADMVEALSYLAHDYQLFRERRSMSALVATGNL